MIPVLGNKQARHLFLHLQGLSRRSSSGCSTTDLLGLIEAMGFVQIDSINTVERAHHMILFSRDQAYKQHRLSCLLEVERTLFENWTHDASIIPSSLYPCWKHRFRRRTPVLRERWHKWRGQDFEKHLEKVREHIRKNGPTMSRDLKTAHPKKAGSDGWWDWHPAKTALEFLWQTGELAVSRREGFQKVYDLSQHVILAKDFQRSVSEEDFLNWACQSALDRLGFATAGEIAAFWDIVSPREARTWCESQPGERLIEIDIETADRSNHHRTWAHPGIFEQVGNLPPMSKRVRVLSPFDPVLRDRKRAAWLFGFDYRIEVFVPEPKRTYGYYVFPLLEGDRMIGRIDMKCHRKEGVLRVSGLWPESGVKFGAGRSRRLSAELDRIRKFTAMERVVFADGYLRSV